MRERERARERERERLSTSSIHHDSTSTYYSTNFSFLCFYRGETARSVRGSRQRRSARSMYQAPGLDDRPLLHYATLERKFKRSRVRAPRSRRYNKSASAVRSIRRTLRRSTTRSKYERRVSLSFDWTTSIARLGNDENVGASRQRRPPASLP